MSWVSKLLSVLVIVFFAAFAGQALAEAPSDSDQQNVFLVIVTKQAGEPATGSSFAIGPELLVTNNHVIKDASRVEVVRAKSSQLNPANVIWSDRAGDMALLRVPGLGATALTFANERPNKGDTVWAVGYPGFSVMSQISNGTVDNSVTKGEVGSIYPFSYLPNSEKVTVFQHTAEISGGNSGGPLFDDCGRVVGLNTAGANREVIQANLFISTAISELETRLRQAPSSPGLAKSDGECVDGIINTLADEEPPTTGEADEEASDELGLPEETLTDEDLALVEDLNPDGSMSGDGIPFWLMIAGAVFAVSSIALIFLATRDKKTPTGSLPDDSQKTDPSETSVRPAPSVVTTVQRTQARVLNSTNGRAQIVLEDKLLDESQGIGIGRAANFNDIVLEGDQISRRHSRIVLQSGVLHIEDLNSSNGTLVNSARLEPFRPHAIKQNDIIEIGDRRYRLDGQG